MKTFLCESVTGYTHNSFIYFGADTSYTGELDKAQFEKIFHNLLSPLGTGHHVFANRYYITYNLVEYLTSKKTYYTGTLMSNRKSFPKEMATFKNLKHKELNTIAAKKEFYFAHGRIKKPENLLSQSQLMR